MESVVLAQEATASWPAVAGVGAGVLMVLCVALAGVVRWLMTRVDSLGREIRELERECREDRRRLAHKLNDAEQDRDRLHEQNSRQQRELDAMRHELDALKAQPPRVQT